jgi:hypothetical protein
VRDRPIALRHRDRDIRLSDADLASARTIYGHSQMSRTILSLAGYYLLPHGKTRSDVGETCNDDGTVPFEDVRAVATEGALTTAADASSAALVSLWPQDERLHRGRPRRGR